MAKLVDAPDLGSGVLRRVGSSPITRTIGWKEQKISALFLFYTYRVCHTEHSEVSTSRSLLHFMGSVEIYCGCRFRSSFNSTANLNLDCSLVFSSSLSFMFFHRVKEPKRPARGKSSRTLLCSGIAKAISFSQRALATWTFLLIFGWCGSSSVSHSPRRAPN